MRKNRTPEQEVGHTVEVNGIEREVTLVFALHKAERATRHDPGCPAEQELIGATFDDDGSEVPEGLIDEDTISDLGVEAAGLQDMEDEAAKCRAEDAAMEAWKERRWTRRGM
jgi:hypothetical protein